MIRLLYLNMMWQGLCDIFEGATKYYQSEQLLDVPYNEKTARLETALIRLKKL